PRYRDYRKFFAGAFPGLILAFYTVPDPPAIAVLDLYVRFALYILAAVGSFFVLERVANISAYRLTSLYGALAFNYFYWFTAPLFTLLEIAEAEGLPIEAGCRLGVCGADPVGIQHGMENLSPIGDDEQSTLERLGLAASTRLACSARVQGAVTLALKPERAGA